jgi:hypothetical protein
MKRIAALIIFSTLFTCSLRAQTAAGISDEDLKRYALTMDSVKIMQETLTQVIAATVQQNTVMTVQRYNQLYKIAGSETELAAASATQEERDFLKELNDLRQYNIARINTAYQALAKEYVGLKAFNSIKKSLETDDSLKKRYESIAQEIQSSRRTGAVKG